MGKFFGILLDTSSVLDTIDGGLWGNMLAGKRLFRAYDEVTKAGKYF